MALEAAAAEAFRRAVRLAPTEQAGSIEAAFPDRPQLRSTLVAMLEDGASWLQTGGAWIEHYEEQIRETLNREPLAIGERVGGVRISAQLGSGGMGTVYLGIDERLDREVAVKTVHFEGRYRDVVLQRFEREAKVLSRLNHPAICQIYSMIDAEVDGQSFRCLVLELVRGRTVREAQAGLGRDDMLRILEQVARALAVAHAEGIIHRDLKPENLMLTPEGNVKILDFGIARFGLSSAAIEDPAAPTGPDEGAEIGVTEGLAGTPRYMSPEQALCEPLTCASDLYSLGLLLKEVLTGRSAHPESSTPFELIRRAAAAEHEPLGDSVEAELAGLVAELLAREPSARPSAEQVAARLRWFLDRPARRRRQRVRAALAALVGLALAATTWAGFDAWQTRRDAEQQSIAARRLGEEVRSINSLLRMSHLAPAHDVRQERSWVEQRLRWMENSFGDAGMWATGPLAYAQGRIALAQGRANEARTALQSGWDLGYREADVAEGLGLAFGALYEQAADQAQTLATPDQRQAALALADEKLRRPAVEWLRHAGRSRPRGSSAGDDPGIATAWIALYENRFEDARRLAARAAGLAPWRYEAFRIEAMASLHEARLLRTSGRIPEAAVGLRDAEKALDRGLAVGRSDPELHLERCRLGEDTIRLAYDLGQDPTEPYERAVQACRAARTLLPGSPQPWLVEAKVEYLLAWSRSEVLRDPTDALDRLETTVEQALQLDPNSAEAYRLLGTAASERGQWAGTLGQPSRLHFDRARASLHKAIELDAEIPGAHYSLGVALFGMGFEELVQGEDPRGTLQRAADALRQAQRQAPASVSASSMMGSTYGVMAMYSLENGLDPLQLLRRSIAAFERCLEVEPDAASARGNLGMAYRDLAHFHWLVGDDPEAIEQAVAAGQRTTESLIADKPDSIARVTVGELGLILARSLLDRGQPADDALDLVEGQAAKLGALGVHGTDSFRLLAESLELRARAAVDDPEVVESLTRRADAVVDQWMERSDGHLAWIVRAKLALRRAAAGLSPESEAKRGLEAVAKALEMRPDVGDAYLLKARLLQAAGSPASMVAEALQRGVERNAWLERQARAVRLGSEGLETEPGQ